MYKKVFKIVLIVFAFLLSSSVLAQKAVLEKQGVYGECYPHYTSMNDTLDIYKYPNKDSTLKAVPYGKMWDVPYIHGVTRVISTGKLIALKDYDLTWCKPALKNGEGKIHAGDEIVYLYYTGEGYGDILFKGSQCSAPIDEGYGTFELVSDPLVQVWLKVLYKDGSSPGWLLNDGSQTTVGRVDC